MAFLLAIYLLCKGVVAVTGFPVPASVLGIVLLFFLLCAGIVKETHIAEAVSFFLKHLVFFFIPVAVGLMDWFGVFYEYGVVLLVAFLASFFLPFHVVGLMLHKVEKGDDK